MIFFFNIETITRNFLSNSKKFVYATRLEYLHNRCDFSFLENFSRHSREVSFVFREIIPLVDVFKQIISEKMTAVSSEHSRYVKTDRSRNSRDCIESQKFPHRKPFVMILLLSTLSADHPSRVSGKMESDTAWASRRVGGGSTEASGRRALRVATVCGRAQRLQPSTRAPGRTGCRTATARRPTLMEV